jgi:hypothetical protein
MDGVDAASVCDVGARLWGGPDLVGRRRAPVVRRAGHPGLHAIDAFLAAWNDNPKPFVWTAKADDIIAKVRRARAARSTVSS